MDSLQMGWPIIYLGGPNLDPSRISSSICLPVCQPFPTAAILIPSPALPAATSHRVHASFFSSTSRPGPASSLAPPKAGLRDDARRGSRSLVGEDRRGGLPSPLTKDLEMEKHGRKPEPNIFGSVWRFLRRCLFLVLALGPMPNHIAFIMDGNRRYAKRRNVKEGTGHGVGFTTLTSVCRYCFEMGVKYVTVYAFSIDNFKRKPEEVQSLMDLMKEKIDELLEEESIVQKYGFRINFWGSLDLLSEPVRLAAEKAMAHTASNTGPVLSVCVAYTSTNEIMRAIKKSCARKRLGTQGYANCDGESVCEDIDGCVTVADLEENLDTADCPDPDIVIRTSGETRLSNFLLWQTSLSHLQNPNPLWPEFSLRNLIWAILEYQKIHPYLEARRRLAKKEN